jgi:hypothetical protein
MEITAPSFAREAITAIDDGLAVFKHPRRDCIYTEAEASVGSEAQGGKYDPSALAAQVAAYRAEGYPEHAGLFAGGVVAWDLATLTGPEVGRLWYEECARWSIQDQLSLPVVCWRLGIAPGVFPLPQLEHRRRIRHFGNRWLRIWPHTSKVSA